MKCPYCNFELTFGNKTVSDKQVAVCRNPECKYAGWHLPAELWQELIRTHKALDVAVDALKEYEDRDSYDCNGDWCGCEYSTAHKALEQITALEQKDVK